MKKITLIVAFGFLVVVGIFAQTQTVKGIITDKQSEML